MVWLLPPSPTVSDSDSLADIADLDAFLAAQGDLSHFPTPPPSRSSLLKKDEIVVTTTEILEDEVDELSVIPVAPIDGQLALRQMAQCLLTVAPDEYVADVFSAVAGTSHSSTFYETVLIQDMLKRALLPPEILGLALNILNHYNDCRLAIAQIVGRPIPADLLTAAALVLAVDYLEDNAPNAHYWSRHVTWDVWTPRRIDETRLHILQTLDWRLHHLATPKAVMDGRTKLHRASIEAVISRAKPSHNKAQPPLRLEIGDAISCWVNGQLTPEASPSPSSLARDDKQLFLPLLCLQDKEQPALRLEIGNTMSWWMDGPSTPDVWPPWSLERVAEPLYLPLL